MWWWPLLFLGTALADDISAERYCFSSPQASLKASQNLRAIALPTDVITLQNECFTVQMMPHRRELIQGYIRKLDPAVKVDFSSAEIKREPCHLKVEKVKTLNSNNLSGTLDQNPSVNETSTQAEQKEEMSITTLKNFELAVNQDIIKGDCRFINPERYEINLEVIKEAKPLYPGLPEGSVVIANLPPPADQQTSRLQTSLQLSKGQKIEIGGVIKDLREKSHEADASPKASAEKVNNNSQERVFLSLD